MMYLGIDPSPTFEDTAVVKCDPHNHTVMRFHPSRLRQALQECGPVVAVGIEMPITRGATSGYKNVWNMHQNAVIIATLLAELGCRVYAAHDGIIRSQVCGWPPRDRRGKIIKTTSFDSYWYRELPARGWKLGKGTVLGQSGHPGVDRRDALAAALFATARAEMIQEHLWRNPL